MTDLQPIVWLGHMLADETAPHQIRIQYGPGRHLNWSCTCQPTSRSRRSCPLRAPLGEIETGTPIEDVLAAHTEHARTAQQRSVS
jgi:hypothetical protein